MIMQLNLMQLFQAVYIWLDSLVWYLHQVDLLIT